MPADCVSAPALTGKTADEVEARFDDQRRDSAIDAMGQACAVLQRVLAESGPRSFAAAKWRLLIASTLVVQARTDEAKVLLDRVRAEFEALPGDQRQWLAEAAYWEGYRKFVLGAKVDAIEDHALARRLLDGAGGQNQLLYARVLIGLANGARAGQDFGLARELLLEAERRLEALGLGESMDMTDVLNALMRTAGQQQDFATARQYGLAEVALTKKLRGPLEPELRYGLASLGVIYINLQQYDEAERMLREAMAISDAAKVSDVKAEMLVLTNLAGLLTERGNPWEALALARRAIAAGEEALGAGSVRLIGAVLEAGAAQEALGDYPVARRTFARALDLIASNSANVISNVHARALRHAAALSLRLGDLDAAQPYAAALEALARQDGRLPFERAQAARYAAEIEASQGRPEDALRDLDHAAEYLGGVFADDHPGFLELAAARCSLQIRQDAAPTQCADAERRLAREREMSPRVRQSALLSVAAWKERRGQTDDALGLRLKALAAAESLGAPDLLWLAHDALAVSLNRRGEKRLAIFFGKQAIAAIQGVRANFQGEDARYDRVFLADKTAVYRRVADWLMEAGRFDEAIEVIRLLKLEEYFDFVQRDAAALPSAQDVSLSVEEQALADDYAAVRDPQLRIGAEYERLTTLDENNRATAAEKARLAELTRRRAALERELAAKIDAFVAQHARPAAAGRSPAAPEAARSPNPRRLGHDTAVGVYLFGENRVRLLIITRLGRVVRDLPLPPADLSLSIGRFLAALGAKADVDTEARALYSVIAQPLDDVARQVGAKRLELWLDGALRYLPFAALHDGKRYLADKYTIEIVTAPGGEPHAARARLLGVRGLGVTRAVSGFPALPAVADELCAIVRGPIAGLESRADSCAGARSGALSGEGYVDAAFTEVRLRSLLDGAHAFSYLHLGTHFSLRPGNAARSFLLLGDGSQLTLDAIRGYSFAGVELVTLSGCQTGLGGATSEDGREVEGLSAVVQRRGARHVIASLWRVEDKSTARLMGSMYGALATSAHDAAQALRQAQLSLRSMRESGRQPYAHPYYWAGFVVSGSGR